MNKSMKTKLFRKLILTAAAIAGIGAGSNTPVYAQERPLTRLLTKEEVGASALPDTIAPIEAPFEMPRFEKPVFPTLSIDITDKGAAPDRPATLAIQSAIDEVNGKGGGTVVIPPGVWTTGRISLKSNVNLHLAEGAELHFSGDIADYQPVVFTRSAGVEGMSLGGCIYALDQENIAITGKGKLVGPAEGSVRDQSIGYGTIEETVPLDKPASERIFDGRDGEPVFLPSLISPVNCRDVYIEGISLERSAFWNIVPVYCDGVIIRGVTVRSVGIPMGDGIDLSSSRNVLIEYCTLSCGDDCFTIKAGRGKDGLAVNRPSENIVIRYSLAREGHGGITCGSETAGMIRNLYVHDCVFDNTNIGIRFKTRRPRGGGGENLYYERIRMNLRGAAFAVDMLGSSTYVGELAGRLPGRETDELTPSYRNITARDILIERTPQFLKIRGLPESPLTGFQAENIRVNCENIGSIHDATNLTLRDIHVQSPNNNMDFLNAQEVLFENVRFEVPGNRIITEVGDQQSRNIRFENCFPAKPEGWKDTTWQPAE